MTDTSIDTAPWLRTFAPAPQAPVRLVCLPHAGGSASYYLPMARGLAPEVEVVATQYPGRQDRRREPCRTSLAELADDVAEVLVAEGRRPLALFGHSMGATLAFELARRLEQRPEVTLRQVFVSGRRAPSTPQDEGVHRLDDAGLLREVRRLDGTAAAVLRDEEMMRSALPAIRADYTAAETYHYDGAVLRTPITALTGDADPNTTAAAAGAWASHTAARFELHTYPGGHFFLGDHVPAVLALIREQLGVDPA